MAAVPRSRDALEVEEDAPFQRRQWVAQRVGWALMLAATAAALAGLLGHGPLSGTTAADPSGGLAVEYNRFERDAAETHLRVRASAAQVRDGRLRVWVDAAYARDLTVSTVCPQPVRVESAGDRVVYTFAAADGAAAEVTFHYEHQEWGRARGRIGLVGGPEVEVSQVVYP